MSHHNTVLSQLLKFIPRHEFDPLAKQHHTGQKLRKMSRWAQFVTMSVAQLSGRASLRDVVDNVRAQTKRMYHLGMNTISRSTLARVNEQQPYTLYQAVFFKLLQRCQSMAPKHGFKFNNALYSLDSTTIDLCLSVFPWAKFRSTKGAIKLHCGLDHSGYLPTFIHITNGKTHDIQVARTLKLPKHSIVAVDRAYTDYAWYNRLNCNDIYFVTRLKSNAKYSVIERRTVNKSSGLTCDQTIQLNGTKAKDCPVPLRRVGYRDPETGKRYYFLTNNFALAAKTIADIYKARWQVEIFFKTIKQNLKIKSFLGTSPNAVMTQIWIALTMLLLITYLKFCSQAAISFQHILRLLQLNLFALRDLLGLIVGEPPGDSEPSPQTQFKFS